MAKSKKPAAVIAAQSEATPGRGFIERIAGDVALIDPDRLDEFEGCLAGLVQHDRFDDLIERQDALSHDDYWPDADSWEARYKPYNVVNGVLQIPVMGALINRFAYQVGPYATGYTYIERAFERGMTDGNVKGIAFIVDSPGGQAAGNFELVDKLYAARSEKPMRSFVADMAYSGGFSIATASPVVTVTRSGGTGSVGVVTMHVDMSERLSQLGLKVTFIKAGKHKVEGNSFEPLTDTAKARIQKRIDKIYGVFTGTVARNRSMDEDAVRGTEALTYDADESVEIGFADRIGALEEESLAFEQEVAESEDNYMTDKSKENPAITQTDVDTAVTAAKTEAVAGERKRYGDVIASEEYAGREALANTLLSTTDLSAEQIIESLKVAPKAEAAPKKEDDVKGGGASFKETMDKEGGTNVGGGDDQDDEVSGPEANVARIMAAGRKSRGVTKQPAAS